MFDAIDDTSAITLSRYREENSRRFRVLYGTRQNSIHARVNNLFGDSISGVTVAPQHVSMAAVNVFKLRVARKEVIVYFTGRAVTRWYTTQRLQLKLLEVMVV